MQHYFYVNDLSAKLTQTSNVNITLLDFPVEVKVDIDLTFHLYKYDSNMSNILTTNLLNISYL